jgi:hypothetical protein
METPYVRITPFFGLQFDNVSYLLGVPRAVVRAEPAIRNRRLGQVAVGELCLR